MVLSEHTLPAPALPPYPPDPAAASVPHLPRTLDLHAAEHRSRLRSSTKTSCWNFRRKRCIVYRSARGANARRCGARGANARRCFLMEKSERIVAVPRVPSPLNHLSGQKIARNKSQTSYEYEEACEASGHNLARRKSGFELKIHECQGRVFPQARAGSRQHSRLFAGAKTEYRVFRRWRRSSSGESGPRTQRRPFSNRAICSLRKPSSGVCTARSRRCFLDWRKGALVWHGSPRA